MKRFAFLLLIGLLGLLVACVEGQEVAVDNTAVPTPLPTIEPTATETAVPVIAVVVEETAVAPNRAGIPGEDMQNEVTAFPTATSMPRIEATRDPLSYFSKTPEPPRVLDLPIEDAVFHLKPPPLEGLLDALQQAGRVEFVYYRENGQLPLNSGAILPSIYSDLVHYPADGFPQAQKMLVENPLSDSYLGQTPVLVPVLEEGFIQYLNSFSTDLGEIPNIDDALEFSFRPIELDTELSAIWLVTIDFRTYHVRDFALITQLEDGSFQYVPSDLPSFSQRYYEDGESFVNLEYDLTGDGINEVLIEYWAYLGGNSTDKNLTIFTWNGQELVQLENIEMAFYFSQYFEPVYEIGDLNGDNRDDIRVTRQRSTNFDCNWEQVDLYSWQGTQPQHVEQGEMPPDTAVCNLWRVLSSNRTYSVPNEARIPFLERAVSQLHMDQSIEMDWLAYALFQLAVTYVEIGEFAQAQATLNQIKSLPQNSRYAQFVQENEVAGSIISLCRNMVINADQTLNTDIGNYLTQAAIFGIGYEAVPEKRLICDLRAVTRSIIQQNSMPQTQLPVDILASLGVEYDLFQSDNLDMDTDPEWIGILEPESPSLVIFDKVGEEWEIYFINYPFYFPVLELDFVQQDVISDEQPEVIVQLTEDTTAYYAPENIGYDIILIGKVGGEFNEIASEMLYEESQDLIQQLEATTYNLSPPALSSFSWRNLEGLPVEADSVFSYVNELQTAVLTQTDPTVPGKITQLLNYLPSDDPDAQPYIEHLTYLLGYFYELSGAEETAVTTYLDLIQQYPTSPWSWLAWARLEPVEN